MNTESYSVDTPAARPIAFFCRAKPQEADALKIFQVSRRVFLGYPLRRREATYDPSALRTCLVDPMACTDEEWERETVGREYRRQFKQNRNFIPRVTQGSIVVIPRPGEGAVYVGRIVGPFEIVNSPPWAEEYMNLRGEQGVYLNDEECQHIADVAQGWPVDEYKRVDLTLIPGWLRRSMFGRSTYGEFWHHPIDKNTTAYDVLDRILKGDKVRICWTLEPDEIKRRLVDTLTPNSFEHLVVSLLQLEHPNEIWHQTGGPGDGGIDGIGSNDEGEVIGLMQAKLYAWSAPGLSKLGHSDRQIRRYAAVLVPAEPDQPTDGTTLLNLAWIVEAVRRHCRVLPQAHAMRIGTR